MMKLIELKLKKIKGIKEFTFRPEGRNAKVYGKTGSGKTTLADAWQWLMTGKDTKNRANFALKTIDGNSGHPETEYEASAKIEKDGKAIELKKVYKEKRTKKKGFAQKQFTGHTTDYYIDSLPVNETKYKEYVSSVADEKLFKLLTNPFYFSEILPWQDRRILLLSICDNMPSDEDIIGGDRELSEITEFLDGKSVDDCRTILKDQKKGINKALDKIPTRVDEASRALIAVDNDKEEDMAKDAIILKEKIENAQNKKMMVENDKGMIEKKNELAETKHKISKFIIEYEKKIDEEKATAEKELSGIEREYDDACMKETSKQKAHDEVDKEIDDMESRIIILRQQWHEENDKEFSYQMSTVCPACGQSLPEKSIKDAREKALELFNKEKSEKLERIQDEGKKLKASIEMLEKDRDKLKKEIEVIEEEKKALNKKAQSNIKANTNIEARKDKYTRQEEYLALAKQEFAIEAELRKLAAGDREETISKIDTEIKEAVRALNGLEGDLLKIRQNKEQEKRIESLEEEEKTLGREFEELERRLFLLDSFTRKKVELVEGRVNGKFNLARFKLFNQLVNGDLEDCCETTDKKGVPFTSNLSGGEKIFIGLDIINTLSEHYGLSYPIFIDDAVLTTDEIRTPGQQIRLYIQAGQDSLKVVTE